MHLIYVDDSYRKGCYCFAAIAIPASSWRHAFDRIKRWRRLLKSAIGVYVHAELHAVDLCAGRGSISPGVIKKWDRCRIFKGGLKWLARIPGVRVFNVCSKTSKDLAFERLLNRINRTLVAWDSRAILICDEGDESEFTRLSRKMQVYNPIPSRYGTWGHGGAMKHIPIDRILEDPFFKESDKSYFIQLADFCAYALLQKEDPHPARKRYGLHQAYRLIRPAYVTVTNPADPDGIIRC